MASDEDLTMTLKFWARSVVVAALFGADIFIRVSGLIPSWRQRYTGRSVSGAGFGEG